MRILQIVDSLDMGGIQTFLLNLNRSIDIREIQFDYMVFRPHEQALEKEFLNLGARIYKLPNFRKGIIRNRKAMKHFFHEHPEYSIIHYHASTLVDTGPLIEAKKAGIRFRILHCHTSHATGRFYNSLLHRWNKRFIGKLATHYFACGKQAAKWMYGGTVVENYIQIINNGIHTENYCFNPEIRLQKRNELNINDCLVIGHIGRFYYVKNQVFMIEVMKRLYTHNKKIRLLFIGDGPEKESVMHKAEENGLKDIIIFMGIRKDIGALLQAMDVFVLPSLFEGFPVVLVEAQAAGLPCFISDTISSEVKINSNVVSLPLENSADEWANSILDHPQRIENVSALRNAGFDIKDTADSLTKIYKRLAKKA